MTRLFRNLMFACALALLPCAARADIGIVLNSAVSAHAGWFNSSGHSSIYLSRVCAETPVKARMCRPGEMGAVLSAYSNFHEAQPYEWNLIPVSVFLYGVDDPADRPLYGTQELLSALRERYRVQHLGELCTTEDCRTNPDANWMDTVGESFVRTVYIFEIKTTEAQDRAFIERLNNSPNNNHYSAVNWNCADFAKDVINSYFPHAVHADRWNDFGMTAPKAIARSLTHYGDHHKQATGLRVTRFEQLPSNIARSDPARDGSEAMFAEKKFMVPLLLRPEELAFFSASYFLTARFSAERAVSHHVPDGDLTSLQDIPANQPETAQLRDARNYSWDQFEAAFARLESEALEMGIIRNDSDLNHAITQLGKTAAPYLDNNGRPWMNMRGPHAGLADFDVSTVVGITPATVEKSRGCEAAALAYKLQLARVRFYLHSSGMNREALPEFRQDWALLQATRKTYLAEEYSGPAMVTAQNNATRLSSAADSQPRGQ